MDSTNLRERLFFYIVFVILIILMILMVKPFFTVLVVSFISVIILKPVYNYFFARHWVRQRKTLASSLTLLTVFLALVIPLAIVVYFTINQLATVFAQLAALDLEAVAEEVEAFLQSLPFVTASAEVDLGATEGARPLLRAIAQGLADFAVGIGSSLPSLFIQGMVFVVVVASLLPVYDTLMPTLAEISPLGQELSELYNRKIVAMIRSLVFGVFLVAIIQGAVMGVFFWLAGLPYIFLLTLLSMMLAMIPMVGISWLVLPIAAISVLTGNWLTAVIVLIGFYGVVNWIDFFLRPRLLSEDASLNFALFILSIFAGLAWAGIMGLFYGPVLMLLLVTTIQIYAERYAHEDRSMIGEALDRLDRRTETAEPKPDTESGEAADRDATVSPPP